MMRRSAVVLAAGAFAWALSSCISDGPNQTGGAYLAEHGVLLQDPLYHVSLKGVPVDTFWTTDAEPSHLGDTIILAGSAGDFSAEPRLAFYISDTNSLHLSTADKPSTFKLSLGFPLSTIGRDAMKATVLADTAHPIDSIPFEVQSWAKNDSGLSGDQWGDTVNVWNSRYLVRNDTLAVLGGSAPILDTLFLKVKTIYTADSTQAKALPNLFAQLLKHTGNRHLIQLRLKRISLAASDTGAAMLRLGGDLGNGVDFVYGPLLIFGDYADIFASVPSANRLQTLVTGSRRAVNYNLRYTGPANTLVTGKVRGLHVVLDRKTVLDLIDSSLKKNGDPVQPHPASGNYDLAYFVPFARMTLPIAKTQLEGGFPLQINMISAIDSMLGDTIRGDIRTDTIPDKAEKIIWNTYEIGNSEKLRDNVSIGYRQYHEQVDNQLRMVVIKFSQDSSRNDTLYLKVGETKQRFLQSSGKAFLTLDITAEFTSLVVRSYLSMRAEVENNEFRDPQTGDIITDLATRLDRFLKPGATGYTLRATNGIQHLLNRVGSNANILQEFQFQPSTRAAVDPRVPSGADTIPAVVNYPVLSVVTPDIVGKKLAVDVELYLFPLKAR